MPDEPLSELGGRTPLEAAKTPNMDRLASLGQFGLLKTIPQGFSPGSDIGTLSLLGCDPKKYFTGRAPIEAVSLGIELDASQCAFRCNLVTLDFSSVPIRMKDYSAGHITTDEARGLIESIQDELGTEEISFYAGVSYRHIMVSPAAFADVQTKPPHDILGQEIEPWLPKANIGGIDLSLVEIMKRAQGVLSGHPINKARIEEGKSPANSIWLWGQGRALSLPNLQDRFGISGGVISAVDLVRGVGILVGLKVIEVPGITGYIDTDYEGKARYALKALEDMDFVFLHVEAPDEATHNGEIKTKIQAIEDFDSKVVGPVVEGLKELGEHRILLCSDHQTLIRTRTHGYGPVPFTIYSSEEKTGGEQSLRRFCEKDAQATGLMIEEGHEVLGQFLSSVRWSAFSDH